MPYSRFRPWLLRRFACGFIVILIGGVAPSHNAVHAATQSSGSQKVTPGAGLSAREFEAIEAAAARDDLVTVHAIVIAAIARASSRASAIVADAVRATPEHADSIVSAVGSVFPRLERRVAEAAESAVPDEQEEHEEPEREAVGAPTPRPPKAPSIPFDAPFDPGGGAEPEWSGETAIGGTYQKANSDSVSAGLSSKVVLKSGLWQHSGEFDFDYGSTDGDTHTHRLDIEGQTRRTLSDRLFALGILDYRNDRFSGFDYQISEGVGLGYRLFDYPTFTLDVEGGPTLRQSRVEQTGELEKELVARLALNMSWQITDTASFSNETAVFVSNSAIDIESASRALIPDSSETQNVSALEFDIVGNLSARLSYEFNYRSDPPPGGRETNSLGKVSLIHSF